jgi:hypothetical protein
MNICTETRQTPEWLRRADNLTHFVGAKGICKGAPGCADKVQIVSAPATLQRALRFMACLARRSPFEHAELPKNYRNISILLDCDGSKKFRRFREFLRASRCFSTMRSCGIRPSIAQRRVKNCAPCCARKTPSNRWASQGLFFGGCRRRPEGFELDLPLPISGHSLALLVAFQNRNH